jgi:hypothetical protein
MTKEYKLGDPRKTDTTIGPVVSVASAARIRKQVKDAGKLLLEWYLIHTNEQLPPVPSLLLRSPISQRQKREPL